MTTVAEIMATLPQTQRAVMLAGAVDALLHHRDRYTPAETVDALAETYERYGRPGAFDPPLSVDEHAEQACAITRDGCPDDCTSTLHDHLPAGGAQ